jgi:hypothetical protein
VTDPIDVLAFGLPSTAGYHLAEWTQGEDALARWIPVEDVGWLRWLLRSSCATRGDLRLSAVPYAHSGSRLVQTAGGALWVRTESGDSVRRLASFRPRPTLVLQEGTTNRMTAFWMLAKPLCPDDIERANRRLSYSLNTRAGDCSPSFTFSPPGTILRQGRSRPLVVQVAEQTDELHPLCMTKGMKDRPKPDPSKWNGRAPVAA